MSQLSKLLTQQYSEESIRKNAHIKYMDNHKLNSTVSFKKRCNKHEVSSEIMRQCMELIPERSEDETPNERRVSNREILKEMYPAKTLTRILSNLAMEKSRKDMIDLLFSLGVKNPEEVQDLKGVKRAVIRLSRSTSLSSRVLDLKILVDNKVDLPKFSEDMKLVSKLAA